MSSFTQRGISLFLSFEERVLSLLQKRGVRGALVVLLSIGAVFFHRTPVHAQEGVADPIDSMMLVFANFCLSIAGVIGIVIVELLEIVTIPIMQYNGFVSSPIVGAGWSIVRDTVNMFFVAVLLFIAVATIFGASVGGREISWRQSVPRIMVFAVVINFSRTLCGLMIDAAQVVMLTFANALKDIAGGNFIQVFGLRDLISISTSSDRMQAVAGGEAGEALAAFDYMTAGLVSIFLMGVVLIVVLMLTAILVYRIVALWVLIVIAPLAWFLGGAKGVITSDAYAEWWKNFKCYLLVGPVLTFFVWLTLAVAGSGNIANSAGFTSGGVVSSADANIVGGALKIFEVSRLTSYIIGIALMFAGFDAAQKMCAGVKSASFVNNRINDSRGAPALAAGAGAYLGAKGAGVVGSGFGKVSRNVSSRVQGGPLDVFTQQGRARRARAAAQTTNSPFFASVAGRYAEAGEKAQTDSVKAALAGDPIAEAGKDTQVEYLAAIARNGKPLDQDARNRAMALYGEMIGDTKKRKALEDKKVIVKDSNGNDTEMSALQKLYQDLGGKNGADFKAAFAGDSHLSHNLHTFDEARPDISGHADHITDMDEVRKIDKAALTNTDVRNRLKQISSGAVDENGREISAYDFISRGRLGQDKKEKLGLATTVGEMFLDEDGNVTAEHASGQGIDLASSSFTDREAGRRFSAVFGDRPEDVMDIPAEVFQRDGGNNEVVRASAEGLNEKTIDRLLARYAASQPGEERDRLEQALNRLQHVIDVGAQTTVNSAKFERLGRSFEDARTRTENLFRTPTERLQRSRQELAGMDRAYRSEIQQEQVNLGQRLNRLAPDRANGQEGDRLRERIEQITRELQDGARARGAEADRLRRTVEQLEAQERVARGEEPTRRRNSANNREDRRNRRNGGGPAAGGGGVV